MPPVHLRAACLRVVLIAGLASGCLPSQFDDLSPHREDDAPSTACDAGSVDCPVFAPDAGPLPTDAEVPRDAATPPEDAKAPADAAAVDAGPRDAGPPPSPPVDAGAPPSSTKDWPLASEMPETSRDGCVYVQFCKKDEMHPGVNTGAVCRLHTGCQLSEATREECKANLTTTCGTPQKPIFLCDRASKLCVTP